MVTFSSDSVGQATNEYVAILCVVAVLLIGAGTAIGSVNLAPAISKKIRQGMCTVSHGICTPAQARAEHLWPCITMTRTNTERLEGKVAVVKLSHGDTLIVERRSDGTATVSFADSGGLGGELGLGARISPLRVNAEIHASAAAEFTAGRTYEFKNIADARQFLHKFARYETLTGELRGALRKICPWCKHKRPSLPKPTTTYIEGGAYTEVAGQLGFKLGRPGGSASKTSLPLGGEVKKVEKVVLGRKVNGDTTTWYLNPSVDVSGELGAAFVAGSVGGTADLYAWISFQGSRANSFGVTRSIATRKQLEALGQLDTRAVLRQKLRSIAASGREGTETTAETSVTIDLTKPANRQAVADFIKALENPRERFAAARRLSQQMRREGVIDVRNYHTDTHSKGGDAEVALGAKIGGGYTRTDEVKNLTGAWSAKGKKPLREREDCVDATESGRHD